MSSSTLEGDAVGLRTVDESDSVAGIADGAEDVLSPAGRRVGHHARVEVEVGGFWTAAGAHDDGGVAAPIRRVEQLHDPGPPAPEGRPSRRLSPEGDLLHDVARLQRHGLPSFAPIPGAAAPLLRLAGPLHHLDGHHRRARAPPPATRPIHLHQLLPLPRVIYVRWNSGSMEYPRAVFGLGVRSCLEILDLFS